MPICRVGGAVCCAGSVEEVAAHEWEVHAAGRPPVAVAASEAHRQAVMDAFRAKKRRIILAQPELRMLDDEQRQHRQDGCQTQGTAEAGG